MILIELQATGPNGKYVAMQYLDDVCSAIVAATAKGITVVEAAGNGDENFDLPVFAGTGLQTLSGAIVVDAGIPPTNFFDHFKGYSKACSARASGSLTTARSSTYRVRAGMSRRWAMVTRKAAQGGARRRKRKPAGTRTASRAPRAPPIVTGTVAALHGVAKVKLGAPLTPAKLWSLLLATGSAQVAGPGVPTS